MCGAVCEFMTHWADFAAKKQPHPTTTNGLIKGNNSPWGKNGTT